MNHDEVIKYIKNNLRRDDLSAGRQELFDLMGAERYIEFCEHFGGVSSLPVYKVDTLKRAIEKRKLQEDLDLYKSGYMSIKQLAKIHQVSESTVYNILRGGKMWMGKWTKELDKLYERYIDIFDIEPDCDTDADLDDVSYNAFKGAIIKSLITQTSISL